MAKSWDYLRITCGCCHQNSLEIQNGEWGMYYACQTEGCYNRFTLNVYETLLEKVYEHVLEKGSAKGLTINLSRSRLKLVAKVVHTTETQVILAVTNLAQQRKGR